MPLRRNRNTGNTKVVSGVERERLLGEALDLLDFPEVRRQLASATTFSRAGEMALLLKPSYEADEVARLHEETAEAAALLQEGSDIALRAVDDVSVPAARAAKGGLLTGHELLAIAQMLDVQGRARARAALIRRTPRPY